MACMLIEPQLAPRLHAQGLSTFAEFFTHAGGEIISGHTSRNVSRFELEGWRGYLKREHRIYWKDYFQSWWAGFGWVSKSRREWNTLQTLRTHGIGCPEPLAVGQFGGQAFLLVRSLPDAIDLATFLQQGGCTELSERRELAWLLGEAIARLHMAGFTHPDLYAKHIFVGQQDRTIAFIDFQRTRARRWIPWRARWRDLAALNASLGSHAVGRSERMACLRAYMTQIAPGQIRGRLHAAVRAIERRTEHLLRRRKVQAMREIPHHGLEHQIETFRVVFDHGQLSDMATSLAGRLEERGGLP